MPRRQQRQEVPPGRAEVVVQGEERPLSGEIFYRFGKLAKRVTKRNKPQSMNRIHAGSTTWSTTLTTPEIVVKSVDCVTDELRCGRTFGEHIGLCVPEE